MGRKKSKNKTKCYNCGALLKIKNHRCAHCRIPYVDISNYIKEPFILVTKYPMRVFHKNEDHLVNTIFTSKVQLSHNEVYHPYGLEVDDAREFGYNPMRVIEGKLHFQLLPVYTKDADKIMYTIQMEDKNELRN